MDRLEAQQQIIAGLYFGDENSTTGKFAVAIVVLVSGLRLIADVVQDAAAETKSGTMTRVEGISHQRDVGKSAI